VALVFLIALCYHIGFSAGILRILHSVTTSARLLFDIGGWFEEKGLENGLIFVRLAGDMDSAYNESRENRIKQEGVVPLPISWPD